MRALRSLETSESYYPPTQRHIPDERKPQQMWAYTAIKINSSKQCFPKMRSQNLNPESPDNHY
jgi:hypothetical protein